MGRRKRKVKRLLVKAEIRFDTVPAPSDAGMQIARDALMSRLLAFAEQGLWGCQSHKGGLSNVDIPCWTADQIWVDVDEVEVD